MNFVPKKTVELIIHVLISNVLDDFDSFSDHIKRRIYFILESRVRVNK